MSELGEKVNDLMQLARIKEYIDRQREEKGNKMFIMALGIVLGILVVAGAAIVLFTLSEKKKREKVSYVDPYDDFKDYDYPMPDDVKKSDQDAEADISEEEQQEEESAEEEQAEEETEESEE